MTQPYQYWIRTATGLEEIVLQEVRQIATVKSYDTKHRSVFLSFQETSPHTSPILCALRTADDVYGYLGTCSGIDKSKASIDYIVSYFDQQIIPILATFTSTEPIRITVSFLGKRNFNRYYVEAAINAILQKHTKQIILQNEKGEKWQAGEQKIRIHIEGESAYFGYSLQDKPLHRRPWRVDSYNGQLHPPIAAAIAQIAKTASSTTIIDPFCGSGTILIESVLGGNKIKHIGFDLSAKALAISKNNAIKAATAISFHQKDFASVYTNFKEYYIISNPPWDDKHSINQGHFFKNLLSILTNSKGAVLLLPEPFIATLKSKNIDVQEILQTRIRGKLASIIRL